jgi:hypothetical protein
VKIHHYYRNVEELLMPSVVIPKSHPRTDLIAAFLTDLANADRSVHTQRA